VYVDLQSALKSLATKFENIEIDVGGAGNYIPKVDAKIQRIKERYRSIKNGLPWKLPPAMVKDLVTYVVSRINIERSVAINHIDLKRLEEGTNLSSDNEIIDSDHFTYPIALEANVCHPTSPTFTPDEVATDHL
jgi:hypothetical protein